MKIFFGRKGIRVTISIRWLTSSRKILFDLDFLKSINQHSSHLHTWKLCPTILLCNVIHLCKLPAVHGRRANVSDLSHSDKIMKCLHSLFNFSLYRTSRRRGLGQWGKVHNPHLINFQKTHMVVETVNLIKINVWHAEPLETSFYCFEKMLAAQTFYIHKYYWTPWPYTVN